MADQRNGGISWSDETWNVVRGCSRVSPGCNTCYAERQAIRMSGKGEAYEGLVKSTRSGPRWTGKVVLVDELLDQPARWKRPRKIFVNAMSDLFHEDLPDNAILAVFRAMAEAPQHTFQVLTKRSKRMREIMPHVAAFLRDMRFAGGLSHVWLGVSVENQEMADERVPDLLSAPASLRWLSVEPLIGPVTLTRWLDPSWNKARIDWTVVGGESGPNARPMHPDWARRIRAECQAARIPFHFKQWGAWAPTTEQRLLDDTEGEFEILTPGGALVANGHASDGDVIVQLRTKKLNGRELDGRLHDEFPKG